MEHVNYTYTYGLGEADVDRKLREAEHGTLSLARDGEAYGIPTAYHYDGEAIYFRLGDHPESEKIAFIEATDEASFLVYESHGVGDAWSVIVRGGLRRLTEAEMAAYDDTSINERFPPLWVFDEVIEEMAAAVFELSMDEVTGRHTE